MIRPNNTPEMKGVRIVTPLPLSPEYRKVAMELLEENGALDFSRLRPKRGKPYNDIILRASQRHEVDPALIKAIIMTESSYNPKAISRSGAKALMQLMPRTAKALGVQNTFDPEANVDAGVRYFKKLVNQFEGDVKLAVAAYNAGSRHVRNHNGIPPFKETRVYVCKVLGYYEQYRAEQMRSEQQT
jgi:soluble lytic murein transglycosylase-like protein